MSQRTRTYLNSGGHRRLRRLATIRRRAVADLAREAVGRYRREELDTDLPSVDEIATELHGEGQYAGVPRGAAGLLGRMQIREGRGMAETNDAGPEDTAIGSALLDEHERHVADWRGRRAAE